MKWICVFAHLVILGPLVVNLERLDDYQKNEAHIWEHLALMRASIIQGPDDLCENIMASIDGTLSLKRNPDIVAHSVNEMREKLLEHRSAANIWDIKLAHGGFFDLSFIVQYLGLVHAHHYPDILCRSTKKCMSRMADHGILDIHDYGLLNGAWEIFQELLNLFAVTKTDIITLPENYSALEKRMALILDVQNYEQMEQVMDDIYNAVQKIYNKILRGR